MCVCVCVYCDGCGEGNSMLGQYELLQFCDNPFSLWFLFKSIPWTHDAFGNYLEIRHGHSKYLNESFYFNFAQIIELFE